MIHTETSTPIQLIARPGTQEVHIVRAYQASRELVFRAYTDPTLIPKWWGPRRLTTEVEVMEVKRGGRWRFIQRDDEGDEYFFRGVYHEVKASELLVSTLEYEGTPGQVLLDTQTFKSMGNMTLATDHSVFQSVEDRDAMLAAGMEEGSAESTDRLAELLRELQQERRNH